VKKKANADGIDILKDVDKLKTSSLSLTDKERFIYINGEINEDKAKDVIEKLLELQAADPIEEITVIINSPGGEVYSMFSITDAMDMISAPIRTVCLGTSQSAAAFIFICGTVGRRFMTKHSSLMLHQVSGGVGGTAKDIDVTIKHIKGLQEEMVLEIADRSKLTVEQVKEFIDRDFYIKPHDAIKYGLCEGVLERLC
jgi:ATP-dependent Clp protease, protease subunit